MLFLAVFYCPVVEPSNFEAIRLYSGDRYPLNMHVEFLIDSTGGVTFDEILTPFYQQKFVKNTVAIPNFGLSDKSYWFRFKVSNQNQSTTGFSQTEWYLEVGRALLDVAILYTLDSDGGYKVMRSDLSVPFNERDVSYVNSVLPIVIDPNVTTEFYLNVKNTSVLVVPLTLWSQAGFAEKVADESFFYGIYFGILLILIIFNSFLFVAHQDRAYVFYVLYLVFVTAFQLVEVGHGVIQSGWLFDVFGKKGLPVFIWLATASALLFFREYMLEKRVNPKSWFVIRTFLAICVMSIVVGFTVDDVVDVFWSSLFAVVFLSAMLGISFSLWMEGNKNARFFSIAWSCNITGFTIYSLMANGILSATTVTLHAAELGIVLEMTLLSLALADKIKRSRLNVLFLEHQSISRMKQYRDIFDNCQHGKYEMTPFGNIIEVNQEVVTILGYSSVSQVLKSQYNLVRRLYGRSTEVSELFIKDKYLSSEFIILGEHDSMSRYFVHSARIIEDHKTGEALYIDGNIIDVTEDIQKKKAQELNIRERLEKQLAIVHSSQKSQFLSVMSGHIRTSLTAIIGYAEFLKEENLEEGIKIECVDTVVNNSERLLRLINDILDYSKISAGKLEIEKHSVDIGMVLDELKSKCTPKAERKSLNFDVITEYPIPKYVKSDVTRIKQILLNLCDNAIKFTTVGSVALTVKHDNGMLSFLISDTGKGIKRNRSDSLFDDKTLEDVLIARGAFGLAISKKLATLMECDLSVSSKKGKGSVFQFSVPITQVPEWVTADSQKITIAPNDSSPPLQLKGAVLLAEDNIVNQKLIKKVLEKLGVTVIIANDGIEACEYFDKTAGNDSTCHLVLMDINMPRRNGVEATQYLRHQKYDVPIYALTAETSQSELDKAIGAGCNGILNKPLDRKKLYALLKEHLSDGASA